MMFFQDMEDGHLLRGSTAVEQLSEICKQDPSSSTPLVPSSEDQ